MDFTISEEYALIKEMAERFTNQELKPLERTMLKRELRMWTDGLHLLPDEDQNRLMDITKEMGFWGIDVPEELGGQGLGMLAKTLVVEELSKSFVGFSHHAFTLPPDSPNLQYLNDYCTAQQKKKYLQRYCNGEINSAMAVTEPGAGSDVNGLKTRAVKRGDKWVINGNKTFISHCDKENLFFILIAVTDPEAQIKQKFTAFLIDKDTPGFHIGSVIPVIGAMPTWDVVLDNVEVTGDAVLGEVGSAFVPLQNRFGVRRIELAARCIGMAERLIQMMLDQADLRSTFGQKLGTRQSIRNWIADSTIELEGVRWLLYYSAWKADQGVKDLRTEASALKVTAIEMLTQVADRAIQMHGGMGLSKELGIEYVARMVRIWRILEGPSEIHRSSIAGNLMRTGKPYSPFIGMNK